MATLQEGRENVVDLIGNGLEGDEYGGINIGESDDPVDDSQTGLQNEVASEDGIEASRDGEKLVLNTSFTGLEATIRESGVYSDDTSEVQLLRQVVDDVNLEEDDTLDVTWEVEVQDA